MKKTSIALVAVALAAVVLAPAHRSLAGRPAYTNNNNNNNNNQNPRQPKKKAPEVIKEVTATTITVTDPNKKTLTYFITNLTEVDYKGQLSTLATLKPGMLVQITAGLNPSTADRISVDDAPPKK